jgi:hypothetical protein
MRVKAAHTKFEGCPPAVARKGFPQSQTHISMDKEYEVFSISVFEGVVSLQFINDLKIVSWLPAWFFEVCESTLPNDWICSLFDCEPTMILGPEFVAKDVASYAAMVELEADSVRQFWHRLHNQK